jgi:hypothetical protein
MPLTSHQVFSLRGRLPKLAVLAGLLVAGAIVWIAWGSHLQNPAGVAIIPPIKAGVETGKISLFPLTMFLLGGFTLFASGSAFLVSVFVAWFLASWSETDRVKRVASVALGVCRFSLFAFSGLAIGFLAVVVNSYVR